MIGYFTKLTEGCLWLKSSIRYAYANVGARYCLLHRSYADILCIVIPSILPDSGLRLLDVTIYAEYYFVKVKTLHLPHLTVAGEGEPHY